MNTEKWEYVKSTKVNESEPDSFHIFYRPSKDEMYQTIAFSGDEKRAKLIAAAPELLEAAMKVIKVEDRISSTFPTEIMDKLREAILKATE